MGVWVTSAQVWFVDIVIKKSKPTVLCVSRVCVLFFIFTTHIFRLIFMITLQSYVMGIRISVWICFDFCVVFCFKVCLFLLVNLFSEYFFCSDVYPIHIFSSRKPDTTVPVQYYRVKDISGVYSLLGDPVYHINILS